MVTLAKFPVAVFASAAIGFAVPVVAATTYPTNVIAEYVYACMKANGENRATLDRCSCSIDVIESIIPYDRYETAATFRQMGLVAGENGALFRESAPAKAAIAELKRAQAEADIRCF
ncbi:hypothetical protein J2046_001164 [Rhizobium petrolearium]|uniref:hypothetical protein n=1 Tax=Neorhizobium petrolearium TaxID=515361 RepID=UPI001AEACDAC|nr:hypothetical protein [Neorhizobium petrolearium]MBP1842910.1 hypothetical protein [Neorhizobium petrolearium]